MFLLSCIASVWVPAYFLTILNHYHWRWVFPEDQTGQPSSESSCLCRVAASGVPTRQACSYSPLFETICQWEYHRRWFRLRLQLQTVFRLGFFLWLPAFQRALQLSAWGVGYLLQLTDKSEAMLHSQLELAQLVAVGERRSGTGHKDEAHKLINAACSTGLEWFPFRRIRIGRDDYLIFWACWSNTNDIHGLFANISVKFGWLNFQCSSLKTSEKLNCQCQRSDATPIKFQNNLEKEFVEKYRKKLLITVR